MSMMVILLVLFSAAEGRCASFQEILQSFEKMNVSNQEVTSSVGVASPLVVTSSPIVLRKVPPQVPFKPKNLRVDGNSNETSDLPEAANPFDDCNAYETADFQKNHNVLSAVHLFENLGTPEISKQSVDESQLPVFTKSNVAAKVATIGSLLKDAQIKQGVKPEQRISNDSVALPPRVLLSPYGRGSFSRLDQRYDRIESILTEIGETEAVFSEALTLLLDRKIQNLSLAESLCKAGVVGRKSKKTLDRSVSVLRRILVVSQRFQAGFGSLLVEDRPPSLSMNEIEDFLIQIMSSNDFQSSFSDYAFELLELNRVIFKIETKKKGKQIHSQFIQEFNKELGQNCRRLCFINMGSVLILPIQRALKYELFVKELIKAKEKFDSVDRLTKLQEIIQEFASQTNQKLSPT